MDSIKSMPKIELHAHLNGSVSQKTLFELHKKKYGNDTKIDLDFLPQSKTAANLQEFFKVFSAIYKLTDCPDALKLAVINVIKDFADDNVIYLELRTTPRQTEFMTKNEYLQTVIDAILSAKKIVPNIIVKLIPSIDRSQSILSANENLELIIKYKLKYPNLIKAIDLSGNPNCGDFSEFKKVFEIARQNQLKLALHCGEINNCHQEISEMLKFGIDRIGHGSFITGDSTNLQKLLTDRIPIECCLTSNLITGTVNNYDDHHFKFFFNLKHPVIICTDDSGVFDTTLSNELEICKNTFNLTMSDLITLNKNAISYSFANDDEKDLLYKKLNDFTNKI